jgi:hypothetical protein
MIIRSIGLGSIAAALLAFACRSQDAKPPSEQPAKEESLLSVEYIVDGQPLERARLGREKVQPIPVHSEDGEHVRQAWSLRAVAAYLSGSSAARVVEVTSASGVAMTVDAGLWSDSAKLPVLRMNKHGKLKFQWLTPSLERIDDQLELKDVSRIRIQKDGA